MGGEDEIVVQAVPQTSLFYGNDQVPELPPRTYFIHDNYGRPFCVTVAEDESSITVVDTETKQSHPIATQRVWVGKSPLNRMTTFSGGHGPAFDGNTILAQLTNGRYLFIHRSLSVFDALAPIVDFVSPVGNNDVPYPWARDEEGNTYLLIENVILTSWEPEEEGDGDPYTYYYREQHLTADKRCRRSPIPPSQTFDDIEDFRMGDDEYNLCYTPFPDHCWWAKEQLPLSVKRHGLWEPLSRAAYDALMEQAAQAKGFIPLDMTHEEV